jgi:hypothetical protein
MARMPTSHRGEGSRSDAGWLLVDTLVALLVVTATLASLALATARIATAAGAAWDRLVRGIEARNTAVSVYGERGAAP